MPAAPARSTHLLDRLRAQARAEHTAIEVELDPMRDGTPDPTTSEYGLADAIEPTAPKTSP